MAFRVAYFVSHPIQYQAPLLRYLSHAGGIDLQVFFLSDFSLHDHFERAFNETFKWDIGLTEGYQWEVLPNILSNHSNARAWWPLAGVRRRLCAERVDAVWVHGWGNLGLCQVINEAAALGLPVLLRGESSPSVYPERALRKHLRAAFYLRWLFSRVTAFLTIGSRNREFYRQYGVAENRLFSVPYAVDNAFFQIRCAEAASERERFRRSLGLQTERPVILFAGKFTKAKAPEELLRAFEVIYERFTADSTPYLLYAGDGPLRRTLEKDATCFGDAVRFLGFRNQTELPALYALCDIFVLPSRFEPWGLVLNEAMNAGRPVIVSDRVGAASDLVVNGQNGFIYPSGDATTLAARLLQILKSRNLQAQMGESSLKRIRRWDFAADRRGLLNALSAVCHQTSNIHEAAG